MHLETIISTVIKAEMKAAQLFALGPFQHSGESLRFQICSVLLAAIFALFLFAQLIMPHF